LGIEFLTVDITSILEACGCYALRDEAIGRLLPYGTGWRCKLVQEAGDDSGRLALCYVVVEAPGGAVTRRLLPPREFREIVAATGFKQRVRAMVCYYHADRLGYAVLGTANRLEYDQGFFVKGGDGLADVKPLAHLYKRQIYELADYFHVPSGIRSRPPTTDTYPLPQTQQEFFFALPVPELDRILEAKNAGDSPERAASSIGVPLAQVRRAYRDIDRKREATRYLHAPPLLIAAIPEIQGSGI
jgi:NAD+ synthase